MTTGATSTLVVCDGATSVASADVGDVSIEVLGVVDLDDAGPAEILLATESERGPAVRVARVTLRGLEVSDVLADRWIDEPFDGQRLFEAAGFECSDVDDDGVRELLEVRYMPADNPGADEGPGLVNLRVSVFVVDGQEIRSAGIDVFETDLVSAHDRLVDDPRCSPDSRERVEIRFGTSGWGRLDPGDMFPSRGDSLMTAVAFDAGSATYVAVGSETPSFLLGDFFDPKPAIWWSTDRLNWERVDLGDAVGELRDVTALSDGGFVAVGRDGQNPVAWLSSDGRSWRLLSMPLGSDGAPGLFGHVISSVAVTPVGVVAVGRESYSPDQSAPGEDLDPAIWISQDGETWTRIVNDAFGSVGFQLNEGDEFNGEIIDIGYTPTIGIVAVGSASEADPTIDYPTQYPTVWVSVDGETWERRSIDVDARLRGIVATDDGVAVLGVSVVDASPTADAVVVSSSDGVEWELVPGPFTGITDTDGIQSINDGLVVPGFGAVAFGSDEAESESRGAAAVWWSDSTLESWDRAEHERSVFGLIEEAPTFTMTGGAWNGSILTIVGFTGRIVEFAGGGTGCCLYEPAIWVWDPARASA